MLFLYPEVKDLLFYERCEGKGKLSFDFGVGDDANAPVGFDIE